MADGCGRHQLNMTGEKTSVHKPLLSAGDVTDKGHAPFVGRSIESKVVDVKDPK